MPCTSLQFSVVGFLVDVEMQLFTTSISQLDFLFVSKTSKLSEDVFFGECNVILIPFSCFHISYVKMLS